MKYLIYARVSPRGSGYEGETSINMQIQYCREYVKSRGGEVVAELSDEFMSGKDKNRPGFQELIAQLHSSRAEWDTICVYKLSRITRSLRDGAEFFDNLYQHNKGFISVTENLDFSTPSGRAMLGMMQVFNQFEREQSAENTRNKMISIASAGGWPSGRPPFGYRRGERKDNKLYVDPRKAEIINDIFKMYASEHPKDSALNIYKKYKNIISKNQILAALRNKIYLGLLPYAGKVYKGQHDAIIDKKLFDMVQRKLPNKKHASRPKAQKYPYLLTGLVYCHCGRNMTPETASPKRGDYHYYRCTDNLECKNRVRAEFFEDEVLDHASKTKMSKKKIEAVLIELETMRQQAIKDNRPELERAQRALVEAKAERERIFNLLLNDPGSEQIKKMANEKINALSSEIDTLTARVDVLKEQAKEDIDYFTYAKSLAEQINYMGEVLKMAKRDKRTLANADRLRQAVLTKINRIDFLPTGEYVIRPTYDVSSNCESWHPQGDSNPCCRDENPVS